MKSNDYFFGVAYLWFLSLFVVLFLSLGAFFIYKKEHLKDRTQNIPKMLKRVDIKIYQNDSDTWDIKGDVLKISGQNIYLKDIAATNYPYTIKAKEGKINKDSGVGYLKKDVVISKASKSSKTNSIYTQYTNIDLKNSHFWASDNIIFDSTHYSGEGSSFDINLKPSLHVIIYNIKSYEK